VVVVTGHQRAEVEATLKGLSVAFAYNADYAQGLSTSLKAGIAALPADVDGAIVCLGDMPQVDAALIDRLIAAFDPEKGALVVVPTIAGKRGNPVVWSRRFFPDLSRLDGDVGARHLIGNYPEAVAEVPVNGRAALIDVDTPDALLAVRAEIERA
jgi:molybdenum cofactor cytidylyltransferase